MTLAAIIAIFLSAAIVWHATQAAFTATTSNTGNNVASGTVALADNDANGALFNLTNAKPGDTQTQCVNVTYTGTLGAQVRLYATGGGTLAPYLTLTVTRGTFSTVPGSGLCTGFTNDTTNYTGSGAGIIYTGLLSAYGGTWAAGTVDPSTTTSPTPEVWTTNEAHAYRLTLTVADDNNAQNKTSAPTFTWEARDSSAPASGSYYSQAVLADQPASFWRLNETTGTTATDLRSGLNGTYTNGVTLNQTGPLPDGAPAPSFDGTNDLVNFGDIYDFSGNASFSVDLWVKRGRATPNYDAMVGKYDYNAGNSYGWYLAMQNGGSGNVNFGRSNGGVFQITSSAAALPLGVWAHVAATYDGSNLRIYINGTLEGTGSSAPSLPNSTRAMTIGAHVNWDNPLLGEIANVAVYSYALSATQVQAHYNARD